MSDTECKLGKYLILNELGRGGFATVYRAVDTTLDREVALKVLDPLLMHDLTWVTHFRREAHAVAALEHPHIVTIYEIDEANDRLFIAMKLVRGPDLATVLTEHGALPWDQTLAILEDVAGALDYAHARGVLHRDLKPANILLDPEAGAILTDFGFTRLMGESSMIVSLSGGVVGTPEYIAPELWDGKPASPTSDVYALGCVLYEIILGQKAFQGETPAAAMSAHFGAPPLPGAWPIAQPDASPILIQALAHEPEARYTSAGDLLAAAEALKSVGPRDETHGDATIAAQRNNGNRRGQNRHPAKGSNRQLQVRRATIVSLVAIFAIVTLMVGIGLLCRWLSSFGPAAEPPVIRVTPWANVPTNTSSSLVSPTPTASPTSRPIATPVPTETNTIVPEPRLGTTQTRELDGMVQVWVPGGSFEMGSHDGDSNEQPAHRVTLAGFWLDKTEVTNAQFRTFVESAGQTTEAESEGWSYVWTFDGAAQLNDADWAHPTGPGSSAAADHPVVHVSWWDADAYCAWAGGQLPTEAQWEYAARGADGLVYPWGDEFVCSNGNFDDEMIIDDYAVEGGPHCDGYARTAPVGQYPAGSSWVGAVDMAGNVWEWIADWYGDYKASPQVEPAGPSSGSYRVVRGGSWYRGEENARTTNRSNDKPISRFSDQGFRCVHVRNP